MASPETISLEACETDPSMYYSKCYLSGDAVRETAVPKLDMRHQDSFGVNSLGKPYFHYTDGIPAR